MPKFKITHTIILLLINILSVSQLSTAQKLIKPPIMRPDWTKDYAPFRIAGNLYYVGTYDLASYLITTPKGDILINTGLPGSEQMIRAHVEKLGFKFSDIKILLATHAHYDHVGAMAAVKKMTRAKLEINEKDAPVLADGGNSDYAFGGKGSTFPPVKADVPLHEHDTVKLGGMQIAVLHHPGHTKGACSFLFTVNDGHKSYRIIIANMPSVLDETNLKSMPTYPDVAKDYAKTFDAMKKVQFDLFLASHASQFDLQKKHKPGDAYRPEIFIDRKGYDTMLNDLHTKYLKKLNDK